MVYNWLRTAQRIVYPGSCLLCGAAGCRELDLCQGCLEALPRIRLPCSRCGEPLTGPVDEERVCGACQKRPPAFDLCRAALAYQEPVPRLVSGFKFRDRLTCGRLLAELLGVHLEAQGELRPELIIPVPLHPRRLHQRGFNQALELARPLARRFGIPLDIRSCRRTRQTRPQTELDRKLRTKNLRGAFSVASKLPARHVAVVDDVVTTGTTTNELAKALKQCGVERVEVWAAARALHD
jgi:ComF family protein